MAESSLLYALTCGSALPRASCSLEVARQAAELTRQVAKCAHVVYCGSCRTRPNSIKMVFNKCGMLFTRLGRQLVRLFATLPFGRRTGKQDEGLNDRDRNTQSHKNFVQGVHVLS